jgi:hypothetical protein
MKMFTDFRKSFLAIYISFGFGVVELVSNLTKLEDKTVDDVFQKFLITNIFGLCLTITIEIYKKWNSETQMAHFASNLPTTSSLFPNLMEVIKMTDSCCKQIESTKKNLDILEANPLENALRQQLRDLVTSLETLSKGHIITPHEDNLLSITLSSSVPIIRAISLAETDTPFWKSIQGQRYLEIQGRISSQIGIVDYKPTTKEGVFRIFVIDDSCEESVRTMIVEQINRGVNISLLSSKNLTILPPDELAIFGDVAVRKTRRNTSRVDHLFNDYHLALEDISTAINQFDSWWNRGVQIKTDDHENFSRAELDQYVS